MDTEKNKLRKKAEDLLQKQLDDVDNQSTNDEIIHELRVHQIELELQNEELMEAQIKLEDSRREYFELYDLAPVGYLSVDANGIITKLNLTVGNILGRPRENLINSSFIRYIAPNSRGTYFKHTQEVLKSQTKQQCNVELLSQNKIPIYASLYTMVVNDEDGNFKEFRIILTDITEHKMVEDAFAKKKEELQTIFDSSRSFIFYKDKENNFLQVNKAFAEIIGMPREKLEGVSLFDIFPKEQAEAYWKDDKEVIKSERSKLNIIEPLPFKDTIRYVQTDKIPYRDLDGNIIGIMGFADDITQRKQTEEELLKAKEEWEHTFDAVPDLINIVDKDYKILQVNKPLANQLGLELEDCIGLKCYELIHGTNEPPLHCPHKSMLEDGLEHTLEVYECKFDGDFLSSASPIYNEKNELTKSVHVLRDITKIKKIEKDLERTMNELERSNKELSQFAYVASHDLKEPLRMITSFLQLLNKRYADDLDEDANDFINYAVDGAKRMDMMINDLLEYSRIGSKERKFEYLQSEKILETVLINLKPLIEDTNAIITHDPLPLIFANEQQMIQVFQNLIGNAIKYHGKENPEIYISSDNVDDKYIFSVKDNGIGIDPKHVDKIFTIFQRLHSRDKYDGTGIGLAISKRILQKHRGDIWVESEPGKGSTFYFKIPNRNY